MNSSNDNVSVGSSGHQFTNEQMEKLLQLLNVGNNQQSQLQMAGTIYFCNSVADRNRWLVDSGSTFHFTYNAEMLTNIYKIIGSCSVTLPNGEIMAVYHAGTYQINNHLV